MNTSTSPAILSIDKGLDALKKQYAGLNFPPPHFDPTSVESAITEKLKTCTSEEVLDVLREASIATNTPAVVFDLNGKPSVSPGVFSGLLYVSDCLIDGDPSATARIGAVAAAAWGVPSPIKGEILRTQTEAFNVNGLSFVLGEFLARHRLTQQTLSPTNEAPYIFIGNAAVRDQDNPDGVSFYLAHLKGSVIAIVSGLKAFSDVTNEIIGDVHRIDIDKVISIASCDHDKDTHFRSQFLDAAAALFSRGHDILAEAIPVSAIPKQPSLIFEADGTRIVTTLGHSDGFENLKLRLTGNEVELLGWENGDKFWITINGVTQPAVLNGAIADGHKARELTMTVGSSWHGEPPAEFFVDLFLNQQEARELFRMNGKVPIAGMDVEIRHREEHAEIVYQRLGTASGS